MSIPRQIRIGLAAVLAVVVGVVLLRTALGRRDAATSDAAGQGRSKGSGPSGIREASRQDLHGTQAAGAGELRQPGHEPMSGESASTDSAASTARRGASRRRGVRKSVVDPMASWNEMPAWPEGPRIWVEVETTGKRYVNLRPNDGGVLPQLQVEAGEMLDIILRMPESSPGERIHIELPNGGRFADLDAIGRVFPVSARRDVRLRVEADDTRGNCTIFIRQAGHSRTLPLWVGEPVAVATDEDSS